MQKFISFSVFAGAVISMMNFAHAAEAPQYNCDGVMRRLMQSQCDNGTCGVNIASGKVFNTDKENPAEVDGGTSSIRKLDNGKLKPSVAGYALDAVKVEIGNDGTRKLTMEHRSKAGLSKSEYTFDASSEDCALVEKASRAPGEKMKVDFDRSFCTAAANTFLDMPASEAKRCMDLVQNVADAYQKRSAELAKNDRSFRESKPVEGLRAMAARAANGDGPLQNVALEAMRQRDRCIQAATDVDSYRPMKRLDYAKLLNRPNGAWLFDETQRNDMSTKSLNLNGLRKTKK